MGTGAITAYIDVAQLTLYAFWIFFAGLIYYLHAEDKREGYPLESDTSPRVKVQGWPKIPKPKTFLLRDGRKVMAPDPERQEMPVGGSEAQKHFGAPLEPHGDPMLAAVGPGAYALRADVPDSTADGRPRLAPLRLATDHGVSSHDPDPRGLPAIGLDGKVGGIVRDLWVDRAEVLFRYLEVEVTAVPPAIGSRRVLLPMGFARVNGQRVQVRSITAAQFAQVPATRSPDVITLLEEEKIMAYYGGGTLYATPQRQEPLL